MNGRTIQAAAGLVLLTGCALLIALLSAGASLANGAANAANGLANAATSTALMTTQCTASFIIVVSLIAGTTLGVSGLLAGRRLAPQPPRLVARRPVHR